MLITYLRFFPGTSQIETDRSPSPSRLVEKPRILYQRNTMVNEESAPKQNNLKSDSSDSFEFTIPPEQIVNSVCEDKELECVQCKNNIDPVKASEEISNEVYCSPRTWPNCEIMDPMRIEDDDLTKFIVDGCLKAEAIAVRNQHRPCFKNIKHLCTRTRTDILKPRTTVANIHSQGIPWATKDFIFAFVRLINCWYILKGYLDDHEGTLGKIETALIPEFKECYQRWQNINRDMVKHLINIFVSLDNGITVQNAEIFSSFNNHKNVSPSSCSLPCDNHDGNCPKPTTSKSCPTKISIQEQIYQNKKIKNQSLIDLQSEQKTYNVTYSNSSETCIDDKLKCSYLDGKSVPGILRVKEMFNNPHTIQESIEESAQSDKVCKHHKIYMKPGSYRVPKKKFTSPTQSSRNEEDCEQNPNCKASSECHSSPDQVNDLWKSALESFGPFMESFMKESESASNSIINELSYYLNSNSNASNSSNGSNIAEKSTSESRTSKNRDTQAWVNDHDFSYYNEESIEEIPNQQQKGKISKCDKSSSKKIPVSSRTYRKRTDDAATECSKQSKAKSSREFTNLRKAEGPQTQTVSSMCFLSRRNLGLSPNIVGKFEKIINALWNLQFARYITFEVNAEHVRNLIIRFSYRSSSFVSVNCID